MNSIDFGYNYFIPTKKKEVQMFLHQYYLPLVQFYQVMNVKRALYENLFIVTMSLVKRVEPSEILSGQTSSCWRMASARISSW